MHRFKSLQITTFAILLGLLPMLAEAAAAGSGAFLSSAASVVTSVYQTAISVVYFIGGIGIIVMALFAFLGRFKWVHFFAICGGLFLVAATNTLIQFLGGTGVTGSGLI